MTVFLRETSELVYLQPNPHTVLLEYQEAQVSNNIVAMPKQNLAIYTCKSGPNRGPKGEPGEDKNSWWDTILAAASDESSNLIVEGPVRTYRAPYPLDLTLGYIRMSLTQAPLGAPLIVDVHMNGTTLFTEPLQIDIGQKTSVTSVAQSVLLEWYVPDDAEFKVYITQVGSTAGGAGLKVAITGIKTT